MTVSPTFSSRAGFAATPSTRTRPLRQAVAAIDLVLQTRTAHSQRSTRVGLAAADFGGEGFKTKTAATLR
ncbi:MAG: hypothetical protein SynsKO_07400 [Synoicihabitans sp.]